MRLGAFLIALLFCCATNLAALENKTVSYRVGYGFFKELGWAQATLKLKNDDYKIEIFANTVGLAKFFSQNRREHYLSEGKVVNGTLVPHRFVQQKMWSRYDDRTTYLFDHKNRAVKKIKQRFEDGIAIENQESANDYYADNDILTLYFNISSEIGLIRQGRSKVYYAVGANKKDGRVDVLRPDGEKLDELMESLEGRGSDLRVIVRINQKIFSSENGELFLLFSKEHECTKAILKNVLLFADIRAEIAQK